MNPYSSLMFVMLLLVTGCAGDHARYLATLTETLQGEEARFIGTYQAETLAKPSVRKGPPKLGLYVMPTGFLRHEFEWTDADRESLLTWTKDLQREGRISGASFIHLSSGKGNQLKQLRESARRYDADILLIVDGAATVDRYLNYKGVLLYWTIFGAYYVDGTYSDALCLVRGSLWDVPSGIRLVQEEGQGLSERVGPTAVLDDQKGVTEARRQALNGLMEKLRDAVVAEGSGR